MFWVILLTDQPTNKQTNKPRQKHNVLGGRITNAAFTPGHISPRYMYHGRATCIPIHICRRTHVDGYKLLVRDTCRLYLGDIITIHLCHGRLVSLCIQQQTGDKLATILSPIQDTCRRRQVDTTCIRQHVSWCKRDLRVCLFTVHC